MKEIKDRWSKRPKWMDWERVMIYIPEDGKVKMAKDVPGVLEKLMPDAVDAESKLLQKPETLLRTRGKKRGNRLATAVCGKTINGPALLCKVQTDAFGEAAWVGMTAEEAGKWIGKLVKIKGSLR
jgi:hypothetical protein